jgi:hypothetical protein
VRIADIPEHVGDLTWASSPKNALGEVFTDFLPPPLSVYVLCSHTRQPQRSSRRLINIDGRPANEPHYSSHAIFIPAPERTRGEHIPRIVAHRPRIVLC